MPAVRRLTTLALLLVVFSFGLPAGSFGPILSPDGQSAEAVITSGSNTLISDPPGTPQADGGSGASGKGITPDGRYIAFTSVAKNLVGTTETTSTNDLFVFDTTNVVIERVTLGKNIDPPAISADGRWLSFSTLDPLIAADTNALRDVYLYDRLSAALTRISEPTAGGESNGTSNGVPDMTPDGRYIVFSSYATNLVAGPDTNGREDIFRYDRLADALTRVSLRTDGLEPNGTSNVPSISADGRLVAFESAARNLDPGGGNTVNDVFVRDMDSGTTTLVSTLPDGSLGCCASSLPSISADGAVIAYLSRTPNLVPGDTGTNTDVFVKDLPSGSIQWASPGIGQTTANGSVNAMRMTSNARYVAFSSNADNLVSGDNNGKQDVFVHDLDSSETTLGSAGYQGGFISGGYGQSNPGISDDGRFVTFDSYSGVVVQGDSNGKSDVFVRNRGPEQAGITVGQAIQCGEGPDGLGAACQADPVNSLTGAFVSRASDIALPGTGLPFAFTRSYASNDSKEGALGRGWTHSYEAVLSFEWNGDAVLRNEVGQVVKFLRRTDGSYKPDPANRSDLAAQGQDFVVTRRDQSKLTFNASGKLTGIADRNGNHLVLAYSGGLLSSITETAGRVITFTHNAQSRLTGISLPDGRSVGFGYTGNLLTSVTDLRGGTTTYEYDGSSRLVKIIDQNGHAVVENTYGANGRVTSQKDALGYTSTFSWDKRLHTTTMTDARGKTWKDKYKNNLLVRQTDPLGGVTKLGYDDDANLASITDPRNNTTTMTYGARGNMLTRTAPAPLSYQEVFTYNAQNSPLTAQDGRGNTTSFEYDARGNLIKITQPGSVITELGRDPVTGQLTSVTDPRGKTTTFVYDASGSLDEVTSPMGNKTTFTQDASGRVTAMVEPRGNVSGANPEDFDWLFSYDAAGNLRTRTDPLGNVTEWTFDPAGNVTSLEDANNHAISHAYNNANELTSVTAPGAIETSYAYDQSGNLTSRTDDNLHTTSYEYDEAGRLSAGVDPLGNRWTYGYDAAGNLSSVTDAEGNFTPAPGDGTTTFSFDALNRTTGVDYSDSTPDVSWAYDANSNPVQMTDGLGTETYGYDNLNRLSPFTRGSDAFSYVFDAAGNITRRTYPDGTVVDLSYYDDGRLSSVTSAGKTVTYTYDAAGNVTTVTYPNGTEETRVYDRAGRVTEVTHKKGADILARFTYTLDAVGNPTRVDSPAETTTYQYDALDRLTEACYQASCTLPADPFIRYTYDGVGNRLTESRPTGTTTYAYDAGDRLTASSGLLPMTFTYDRNGNQTSADSRSFTWGQNGLLASTTSGTETTTYEYDGSGKRLRATLGSDVTNFTWDVARPLPELVLERDGSGGLQRRYLYGRDLLQMTTGGSDYTFHHDALGSVAALTSGTGDKVASYLYEPFGSERPVVPPNPPTPDNRMRFTGEYLDPTGLYHLRARQYDSVSGRFTSGDPLPASNMQTYTATYVYARNLPTRLIDPAGLRAVQPQGRICQNMPNASTTDYLLGFACPPAGLGFDAFNVPTPYGWRANQPNSDLCTRSPDQPFGFDFRPPCRTHDYGVALVDAGVASAAEVNEHFLDDLHAVCDPKGQPAQAVCHLTADFYFDIVVLLGSP